eukprot:15209510-Alexandrium_andersonii.AAC.1
MSASLVGSEMCIRDRQSPPSQLCLPALRRAEIPAIWSAARVRAMRGRAAVSYTHLTLPTICSV